jgi:hypothetical protein
MKSSLLKLLVSAALVGNAPARWAPSGGRPFEITVDDLQRCQIAQGDLLFGLSDFRRVVTREMDTRRRILVHRGRSVRQVCMSKAVRSLRRAGFSDIRLAPTKSM